MVEQRGNVTITGSNRKIKVRYNSKGEAYFNFNGCRYGLYLFMRVPSTWKNLSDFSGYFATTAWSGVIIRILDDETLMAYNYHSRG